jgi:membrane-bound lytic murein transglycosylase D
MVIMSFTDDRHSETENKRTTNDSTVAPVRGFKSLFMDKQDYDPANPNLFQLNPKAVAFVNGYVRRESEEFDKMKVWGKTYFDLYDRILAENGLPVELKYLSVIESHLDRKLVSSAGAVGPWQLMPDEAKRYHLKRTKGKDERCDFTKSTYAACKLLNELHEEFGDWLLVIAAYNGGVGRVKQAIRKSGSRNFWVLQSYLPEQTRNHVKKYIGTHYIFEGGGGWTTLTASETVIQRENIAILMGHKQLSEEELKKTETVSLMGKYNSKIIAQKLVLDLTEFNKLNPGFDKALLQGSTYEMRLPIDKLPLFKTKKQEILEASVQQFLSSPDTAIATVVKAS